MILGHAFLDAFFGVVTGVVVDVVYDVLELVVVRVGLVPFLDPAVAAFLGVVADPVVSDDDEVVAEGGFASLRRPCQVGVIARWMPSMLSMASSPERLRGWSGSEERRFELGAMARASRPDDIRIAREGTRCTFGVLSDPFSGSGGRADRIKYSSC